MASNGFDYLYAVTTVSDKRIPAGTGFKVLRLESGIYLFTVDSALGHQIGRFVVVR
jgi:hypothetical protein